MKNAESAAQLYCNTEYLVDIFCIELMEKTLNDNIKHEKMLSLWSWDKKGGLKIKNHKQGEKVGLIVACDTRWSKRSSSYRYDSTSSTSSMVGLKSNKLLLCIQCQVHATGVQQN